MDPETIFYSDGGINHVDHRTAGMAAVDAVYPAARNGMAFPWLARDGLELHNVRRIFLFWSNHPNTVVDTSATLDRKLGRCGRTAARSATPSASRRGSGVGARGGRALRAGRGRSLPRDRD
ncbi:MAG: hypothetical protein U0838_07540 [Chloroflexota bacterium]